MADEVVQAGGDGGEQGGDAGMVELNELREIFGAGDEGDEGGDGKGEGGEAEEEEGDGKAKAKPDPKAEPKPKEEPKKEKLGASWKQLRDSRKALDHREADLTRRAAELETKGKAFEGLQAKAALLDKLVSGDAEAIEALGIDFDKLTAAVIDRQSGRPGKKESAEVQELKKAISDLRAEIADKGTKAAEDARYQQAVDRFEGAAAKHKVLVKFSADKRVAMGHALADELHQAGKPVPPPEEIAGLLAARLKEEWEEMRGAFDDDPPPAGRGASAGKTLSRQDSKERAGGKGKVPTEDEEREELAALLRGR